MDKILSFQCINLLTLDLPKYFPSLLDGPKFYLRSPSKRKLLHHPQTLTPSWCNIAFAKKRIIAEKGEFSRNSSNCSHHTTISGSDSALNW